MTFQIKNTILFSFWTFVLHVYSFPYRSLIQEVFQTNSPYENALSFHNKVDWVLFQSFLDLVICTAPMWLLLYRVNTHKVTYGVQFLPHIGNVMHTTLDRHFLANSIQYTTCQAHATSSLQHHVPLLESSHIFSSMLVYNRNAMCRWTLRVVSHNI